MTWQIFKKNYLKPGSNFWVFEDSKGVVQGMVGLEKKIKY